MDKITARLQLSIAVGLAFGASLFGSGVAGVYFSISADMQTSYMEISIIPFVGNNSLAIESFNELHDAFDRLQNVSWMQVYLGLSILFGSALLGIYMTRKM